VDSTSFQTIHHLSLTLIQQLEANGWASAKSKKLVFLAHSLGGVILKEALVLMAGGGVEKRTMLESTKGAIFFGVPSRGMHISHFLTLVGSQPNQNLVTDLSRDSKYLANLDKQFEGISFIRQMKLFWAYETKTSPLYEVWHISPFRLHPTLICNTNKRQRNPDGLISRSNVEAILVTPESATCGLISSNPSATIQIDENHSDLVKFVEHYYKYDIILSKLREICGQRLDYIAPSDISAFDKNSKPAASRLASPPSSADPYAWDYTSTMNYTVKTSILRADILGSANLTPSCARA
jgi:hypothetical protein